MAFKLLLLALLLSSVHAITSTFTGSLSPSTAVHSFSYNISTGSLVLSVKFEITNLQYSNSVIYVSFAPLTFNLTPSDISLFLQTNNSALSYMDPISAIGGIPQRVNVLIPANITMFYVTIFNLDTPEITITKNFKIQVSQSGLFYVCFTCPFGTSLINDVSNLFLCQCSPCQANYIGPICTYYINKLTTSTNFDITNSKSKFFLISNTISDIDMVIKELTSNSKVYLYVQYQFNNRMIAGKINSYTNQNKSYQYLITSNQQVINIPSNGLNVLLTFQSYTSNISSISIVYNPARQPSSIVIIIIAVCASIVVIVIILVVFFKVKKSCIDRNAVENVGAIVIINQNNLTDREINKYFPEVSALSIFSQQLNGQMMSDVNINSQSKNEQDILPECSICFDNIKKNDFIRVTYCKHVFHAKCLLQWFHKNPICPNCRQHYDYKTTKQFREKFPRSVKSKAIKLIKAILGENYLQQFKSKSKNTKMHLQLSQQKEIQVQSKNLNIPQSQQSNTFNIQ